MVAQAPKSCVSAIAMRRALVEGARFLCAVSALPDALSIVPPQDAPAPFGRQAPSDPTPAARGGSFHAGISGLARLLSDLTIERAASGALLAPLVFPPGEMSFPVPTLSAPSSASQPQPYQRVTEFASPPTLTADDVERVVIPELQRALRNGRIRPLGMLNER